VDWGGRVPARRRALGEGGGAGVAVDAQPDRPWWFRVQGSGFRVQGSGFRVQGSEFRVQGSGFRV